MSRLSARLVAGALALSLAACGLGRGAEPADAPEAPETTIRVTNNNWANMVVYLVRSGVRVRLGTVNSMATAHFVVPRSVGAMHSDVRLVADPIGARTVYVTERLALMPGQAIEFTIENHLPLSTVTVSYR